MPSNTERADRAREMLWYYKCRGLREEGSLGHGELLEEVITDALTDLRHLASREGVDFDRACSRAYIHEVDERGTEASS